MNKSKIEWTDYTWNPVTGCRHGCPYCYARKQTARFSGDARMNLSSAKRWEDTDLYVLDEPFSTKSDRTLAFPYGFEPTLHSYRLDWPGGVKQGANIFVCSMADLFGAWVPNEWIKMVFDACERYPQHNYLFLTKNPSRYLELAQSGVLPQRENMWYGTTTTNEDAPYFFADGYKTFVSIEPILSEFSVPDSGLKVDWVIVGAESGNRKDKVSPKKEWIYSIAAACSASKVPLFMKDSLAALMGGDFAQEFPTQLKQGKQLTDKQRAKLLERCACCKNEYPKKEMTALLARAGRGQSAYAFGYVCTECLPVLKGFFDGENPIHIEEDC